MLAALSFDPLLRISLGPLDISPHGIFIAIGFAVGVRVMLPAARKVGITEEQVYGFATRSLIGAIVGARLFYVLNNFSSFESPVEWFQIWRGGISLLGGITGAVIADMPYARKQGIRFFKGLDAAVPAIAIGIAVGRIGDIIIADHLGDPTTLPFGYRCPVDAAVGSSCTPGEVVHLTAMYDMIVAALVFLLLLVFRRGRRREGEVALVGAMAYALGRFLFDFLRTDTRRLGLTGSQFAALAIITIGALLFTRLRATGGSLGEEDAPGEPTVDEPTDVGQEAGTRLAAPGDPDNAS